MSKSAIQLAEQAIKLAQDALNMAKGQSLTTDIVVVLDRSGSMETIRKDTIGGFNRFLKEQQALPDPATMSIYQFDTVYETVYEAKAIKDAPELTEATFVPRGGTALLDAIGRTINAVAVRAPARPVIVVITDGEENSSKEFNSTQIKELIKKYEAAGWQFVYLGANQDAFAVGGNMGFARGSTMSTAANAVGTQSMYASTSSTLRAYRSGETKTMAFSVEDRKKQEDAGAVKMSTTTSSPPTTP